MKSNWLGVPSSCSKTTTSSEIHQNKGMGLDVPIVSEGKLLKYCTFLKLWNTSTCRRLKCHLLSCDMFVASVLLTFVPSVLHPHRHTLTDACVRGYTRCTYCIFHFSPHPAPICFCLFLFALDRLKVSICIPEQLRDASANKEDDCPCSLKKGQAISGGVSPQHI